MPLLALRNISKKFGNHKVLNDISLDVEKGEVVAIIGRSGSGKSTLLRCINGLELADNGTIEFDGHTISRRAGNSKLFAGRLESCSKATICFRI